MSKVLFPVLNVFCVLRSGAGIDSAFDSQHQSSPFGTNGLASDILQPLSLDPLAAQRPVVIKPLTGDVDTSLSRAADNLSERDAMACCL